MSPSGVHLSSERRDGLSIYRILEQDQVVTLSPLCGIFAKVHVLVQSDYRQVSVMTSLSKEIFDSRILGRGRHQVIQDYHVSYSGIEEIVAVQVHRVASTEFYSWEHGLSDDVVEGLPSLLQPDDSLWQWRHLDPTVL
jgi:hypothetical protein